jgi:membrane-associated phospholipid phosphatase
MAQRTHFIGFFASVCNLHPERTKYTLELLEALRTVTVAIQMRAKHALAAWRPADLSPQVMPMIQTPAHSTYPAGHATEAFMMATVLSELMAPHEEWVRGAKNNGNGSDSDASNGNSGRNRNGDWKEMLMRTAARIAENRVIAGVHFPVDNAAGMVLGTMLGKALLAMVNGSAAPFAGWSFDAGKYGGSDFEWRPILECMDGKVENDSNGKPKPAFLCHPEMPQEEHTIKTACLVRQEGSIEVPRAASLEPTVNPLCWMWEQARNEWKLPGTKSDGAGDASNASGGSDNRSAGGADSATSAVTPTDNGGTQKVER